MSVWEMAGVNCVHCGVELVRVDWGNGLGHPVMGAGIIVAARHYCEEYDRWKRFKVSGVAVVENER